MARGTVTVRVHWKLPYNDGKPEDLTMFLDEVYLNEFEACGRGKDFMISEIEVLKVDHSATARY